ncbi:CCR4-NOT transcription complex subunit 4 [Heracleum sosnowskyi]|uniref:CCR4-NOT transcription complex subunit 4 n=1 Tax=Heracleum sosnowskyi TaxID=360622 RepID=A0AAD8J785_9APIA|nr:CCR4-NOT transcription complex subunit 4 [Heracleum sosnowskyi]
MSNEGEKTCPLCAEEMDLTDQQLKPCKCGYEICVWCWHHIINMAEKDNVEGRCPACRTPYNKEKIVDKAAECERLLSELNVDKKVKSKSKSKAPDGRKNLSSVRVIQRNLVYIVGLPLTLADEDLLRGTEYFALYGKVLKVSISRTAAGTIQQFPNSTCSVYITYSKEEEAVRCIQSVHGYTLEGRPLRACFGTTKYCHAWLRSVPCINPDCLYLHETGTQEDSFTKDEIISAYTRNRVQQSMGATIDMQRRSGNVLPPPADEFCNNSCPSSGVDPNKSSRDNLDISSENILESSVWQTPASSVRGSPPNSHSSKPVSLPAAASWGARASNSQPPQTSMASSNGPSKQKSDTCGVSVAFSTAAVSPGKVSIMHSDSGRKFNGEIWSSVQRNKSGPVASVEILDVDKQQKPSNASPKIGHSDKLVTSGHISTPSQKLDGSMSMRNMTGKSCGISSERDSHVPVESKSQELCSDMLLLNVVTQGAQHGDTQYEDFLSSHTAAKDASSRKDPVAPRDQSELKLKSRLQLAESDTCTVKDDILSFDIQRRGDLEVTNHTDNQHNVGQSSDSSTVLNSQEAFHLPNVNFDSNNVDKKPSKFSVPQAYNVPVISIGYPGNRTRSSTDLDGSVNNYSYMLPNELKSKHDGRHSGELVNHDSISGNDMGESSIISNILSMDFDSWDESLASPQNLAKLLGETDKQLGSLAASNSKKVQNSNQSRFSFAREEHRASNFEPSLTGFEQTLRNHSLTNGFKDNGNYCDAGTSNGHLRGQQPGNFASIHSHNSQNKFSVSRAPATAPPGFSGPTRAPPPGFTSFEKTEQSFDINSGFHSLNNSSFLRNASQTPSTIFNDSINAEIEFFDPAILAVGKGRFPGGLNSPGLDFRSTYPTQTTNYENEARLQLLMQRSSSQQQNPRYVEMGNSFSSHPDNYGLPPRILEQALANNGSQYSQFGLSQSRNQGNWDGWNEVQSGNGSTAAEFLRSERLGVNKYFTGYQDSKYRISSSGDFYNQQYGI